MDIYKALAKHLDPDQIIIFPEMYKKTPWMFSKVNGQVFLIGNSIGSGYDWVWPRGLDRALDNGWYVVRELFIAQVANPNDMVVSGEVLSQEEYAKERDRWEILDTCIVAISKDFPHKTVNISTQFYQLYRDDYEVLDTAFVVRPVYKGE